VAAQIEAAVDIPMLNLADTTARAVLAAGLTRVGLLGTRFTMEQAFYRDRLAGHGIDVVVPDSDDIATVNRVIYDELCLGIVRGESRAAFLEVIDRLIGAGVDGVVLGCTEIELLVSPEDIAIPAFPTTRIHVEAAVDLALT
jgi:aspartate racemase